MDMYPNERDPERKRMKASAFYEGLGVGLFFGFGLGLVAVIIVRA